MFAHHQKHDDSFLSGTRSKAERMRQPTKGWGVISDWPTSPWEIPQVKTCARHFAHRSDSAGSSGMPAVEKIDVEMVSRCGRGDFQLCVLMEWMKWSGKLDQGGQQPHSFLALGPLAI